MKSACCFLIPAILFLLFFSGKPEPASGWKKIKYERKLHDPFFNNPHFKYPWFMIKNDDGSWSSGMGDSLGNDIIDTTLQPVNAQVIVDNDSLYTLDEVTAELKNDTCYISLNCFNAAYNGNLNLKIYRQKFQTKFSRAFIFPTKNEQWETIEQELVLNRKKIRKGDVVKGYIRYRCKETITQQSIEADKPASYETWTDTVSMRGVFMFQVR